MKIVGHQIQWTHLNEEVQNKRLPPAYLFYGLRGIGKSLVATALAQTLMCPTGNTGSCPTCERIQNRSHPDFFWLDTDKQWLRIEEVRELQQKLALTAVEADYRVVVINDADKLTRQASNALLKVVEEPPQNTLFIFIAPNLFQILPTIRSRCRPLYFSAPPLSEAVRAKMREVSSASDTMIDEVYQIAEGSLGLSLQLLGSSDLLGVWEDLSWLAGSAPKSFRAIHQKVDGWVKQDLDLVFLLEIMKKKLFWQQRAQNNFVELGKITRLSQAQVGLKRNLNKTLLLENLLLDLVA